MKSLIVKSLLAMSLATLIASPLMALQSAPSSAPQKPDQPKVEPPKPAPLPEPPKPDAPKPAPPKAEAPKPQAPKADAPKPEQEPAQPKSEQPKPDDQKQDQDKQKKDASDADSRSPRDQRPQDPRVGGNRNRTNVNINIPFFSVTTLPERIRVEHVYRIYEVRENTGLVTVEGTMSEKRSILLNDDTFLVTNLKDDAGKEYPVLLGRESVLGRLDLRKGDQIRVEGHDGVVNNKHMLVAFKVTRQDNTVNVRIGPDGVVVNQVAPAISN